MKPANHRIALTGKRYDYKMRKIRKLQAAGFSFQNGVEKMELRIGEATKIGIVRTCRPRCAIKVGAFLFRKQNLSLGIVPYVSDYFN